MAVASDGELQGRLPEQQVTVTGAPSGRDYRVTESATFTKTDTPVHNLPASITVVPGQLMKDQAMQSLADVIRYVPGALAHQGEGNRDEFIFRGIGSSANLYVDGIRDDAQVFRDLYNLEQVDVIKGAPGMIFGRGAGGVLNRVTKRPLFDHADEVSFTAGSHGQLRSTADLGGRMSGEVAWRLNAMAEDSNSFREGVGMNRYAVNPTLAWHPDTETSLTLGVEFLRDNRTADRGVPSFNGRPLEAPRAVFFGNAQQSSAHANVDAAYMVLTRDFDSFQVKNTLRVTHYDKFYQNVFPATTTPVSAAGWVTLNAYNNRNARINTFNQTDFTGLWRAGGLEHTWLAGVELGHQDSTNRRNTGFFGADMGSTSIAVPATFPFATATAFRPNGTDANNRVKAEIAALYVQDEVALSAKWKVLAGLRYDVFQAALDDRRTTLNATTTPSAATDLAHTDKAFSPRLGLIWAPASASTYYVSYSASFLPSAETLSLTVLNRASGLSTADFSPESAKNFEIGGRWDMARHLTMSAAVFRLDRDHVRNADGNGGFVQSGQQRTQGMELGLQGEVTPTWHVHAGYAHLDAKITKATASTGTLGHVPQLVPADTFSMWNRIDFTGRVAVGLGLIYQGASYANVDNKVQLPAFARSDAALYYTFEGRRVRLALNVENLFDRNYFPTADANNNISVGAPRQARVTLSTMI